MTRTAALCLAVGLLVLSLGPGTPAAAKSTGGTTASVDASGVSISVSVDFCCAHDAGEKTVFEPLLQEYAAQAAATWNQALAALPYKGCIPLRVAFHVQLLNAGQKGAAGHHQLDIDLTHPGRSYSTDPGAKTHNDDTSTAYQQDLGGEFFFEGMSVRTWEHEMGHLMGLGDDYNDVGAHSVATPGRETTLMDGGSLIDQALADRLGEIAARAGLKMPPCWKGTIDADTTRVYTDSSGATHNTCETIWHGEAGWMVAGGTVSGHASITLQALTCAQNVGQAAFQAKGETFKVAGTQSGGAFHVRFTSEGVTGGQADFGAIQLLAFTDPCALSGSSPPEVVIPQTDASHAGGPAVFDQTQRCGGGAADHFADKNTFRLELAK